MTIAEFKAWLEGFEAAMDGPPTAEQWTKIKAKIAQLRVVDGTPTHYWPEPIKKWGTEPRYPSDWFTIT